MDGGEECGGDECLDEEKNPVISFRAELEKKTQEVVIQVNKEVLLF